MDRRRALGLLGAAGAVGAGVLLAACSGDDDEDNDAAPPPSTDETVAAPSTGTSATDPFAEAASCALTPELTEGPFYFDVDMIRSDIREDREGVPLRLAVRVRDAAACTAIADAVLDIWHCDAGGDYSERGETFLRGAQVTNADGVAEIVTVYPGWYPGRTVHIHTKVHLDNSTVLTTQVFFDETTTAAVFERDPYAAAGPPDQSNNDDTIFEDSLVLTLAEDGDGYVGRITFDVERA